MISAPSGNHDDSPLHPADRPVSPPTTPGPMRRPPTLPPRPTSNPSNHPPRCATCGYVLQGLDGIYACPECAAPFDLRVPETYIRINPYNPGRFWMPSIVLACIYVLLSVPMMAYGFGSWGSALFLVLPAAGGAFIGYGTRSGKVTVILGACFLGVAFLGGIAAGGLGGVFCLLVLVGIIAAPILIGMGGGVILRNVLKSTRFDQADWLPLLLIGSIPYLCIPIEKWTAATPTPETFSTSTIVDAPIDQCWEGLVFYEEVKHPAPWILRVGLARPLSSRGGVHAVGDTRVCIYNRGTITKQLIAIDAPRQLDFAVVAQEIGYERDLMLLSGSFRFESLDAEHTRITLSSTYEPRLNPRFCWRWGEKIAFRTLHGYVLEGIALNASEAAAGSRPPATTIARDAP